MRKRWLGRTAEVVSCTRNVDRSPRCKAHQLRLILNTAILAVGLSLAAYPVGPAAAADFSCLWTTGTSGFWNVAGNWSTCNGTIPNNGGSTFDATIAAAGTYTVTLNTAVSLNKLTLNAAGATVDHTAGTLTMAPGGVITIQTGAYRLNGGTISGGTIQQTGSNGLHFTSSTTNALDGVTVLGDLNLTEGSFSRLQIRNGLTLRNEANTGNGVANVANNSFLMFVGTQTFNNATVNLSGGSALTVEQSGATTLTLGSNVLVQGAGGIGGQVLTPGPVALINQGILRGNVSGQNLTIGDGNLTLTNAAGATIEAVGGGVVTIGAAALTNAGTINAGAGSSLRLSATNLINTGTINVLTGTSTLTLDGATTTAALANFNNTAGGTFNLTGTLTNTADTLTLGGHLGAITLAGGTIKGGIVQEAAPTFLRFTSNPSNALDGVTVLGDLNLTEGSFSRLQIRNGLTLRNEANTGNGVANVANNSFLMFVGTQTFNNATVNLSGGSALTVEQSGATTLTLGSNVLVQGTGGIGGQVLTPGPVALINQGILRGNVSGQNLTIGDGNLTLTNAAGATIEAVGGGVVTIGAAALTNAGTINAGAGSSLRLSATNLINTGTINVLTGTSTLTLDGATTTAALANFNNTAGGTFNLTGTLTNTADTLTLGGHLGAITLAGGTIKGGIVQEAAPTFLRFTSNPSNALDGVTVLGDLNLTEGSFSRLQIRNGLTLRNEANTGNGVANVANNSFLMFVGTQTFNNATVNLSGGSALTVEQSGATTLTLGSNVLVQGTGGIGGQVLTPGPVALINQGILRGNVSGQNLTIGDANLTLTNAAGATIEAVGGGVVTIGAAALTNAGTINAGAGSSLRLSATNLINTGTINVLTGTSTLTLDGATTTAALANFNNTAGGTFNLTGTLTNTADTLTLGGHLGAITLAGGTIKGGIVQEAAPTFLRFTSNPGNALDGVTVLGDLNLTEGSFSRLQIRNGLTLRNQANTGNGVANVANNSFLMFVGTQTFNNATVNLSGGSALTVEQSGATTLTLGSNVLVQGTGGIGGQVLTPGPVALINQGILRGNVSGQNLTIGDANLTLTNAAGATIEAVGGGVVTIGAAALTNNGTIAARSGGVALVNPTTLTNSSGGTLTGGTWASVGSGSTLTVRALPLTTNAAEIIVDGAGSVWRTQNPITSVQTALESSLTTNAAGGALRILNNRGYTTTNALSNAGTMQLGGGTLNSASLVNTGTFTGFGTVTPQIGNQGNVVATGGTLTVSNAIQGGTGNITIDGGAALNLSPATVGSSAAILAHNGANLNLGAHDLTVFSSYTNANFGIGNGFDNRANVTGSGQIQASGVTPGTAQFLTGDIVGGGTTTGNAVINFGNVHVGDAITRNYQIGNTNTGGPSLSGAIQTAVNGGHLTDSQLSGNGVTAGNWGPVGQRYHNWAAGSDAHRHNNWRIGRPDDPYPQQLRQHQQPGPGHSGSGLQPGGGEYDADAGDAGEPAGGWEREPDVDGGQRGAGGGVHRGAQCELR